MPETEVRTSVRRSTFSPSRLLNKLGLQVVIVAALGVITWHYTETGDTSAVRAEVRANHEEAQAENKQQNDRLDFQREMLGRKADKAEVAEQLKEVNDSLRELRAGQQQMLMLQLEMQARRK